MNGSSSVSYHKGEVKGKNGYSAIHGGIWSVSSAGIVKHLKTLLSLYVRIFNPGWDRAACGLTYSPDGSPAFAVIAGGSSNTEGRARKMDVNTKEWSWAPNYPRNHWYC